MRRCETEVAEEVRGLREHDVDLTRVVATVMVSVSIQWPPPGTGPLRPELAGHAGMEVAPEKVKAFMPTTEVDHSGLVRMKRQAKLTQDGSCLPLGSLGLLLGRAQHHEGVRIADDFSSATLDPGPVKGMQVDVGEGRYDCPLGGSGDRLG